MSTRSGKRIHSSFLENTLNPDVEQVDQGERKTRSRRLKDNVEALSVSVVKTKKRSNYVSYPTDDELGADQTDTAEPKQNRPSKIPLKEQNFITISDPPNDAFKLVRTTRRTHKLAEDTKDAQENLVHMEELVNGGTKSKKEKKKKKSIPDETVEPVISKKKSKKKVKKGKRSSGSIVVEDIVPENGKKETLNKSNISTDSFHSAAGSPPKNTEDNEGTADIMSPVRRFNVTTSNNSIQADKRETRLTRSVVKGSGVSLPQTVPDSVIKSSRKRKSSFQDLDITATNNETIKNSEFNGFDTTLTSASKKRKSSIKDSVNKKRSDMTSDEEIEDSSPVLEESKKSVINTTYDKSETLKSTDTSIHQKEDFPDKSTENENKLTPVTKTQTPQSKLNLTYEKSDCNSPLEHVKLNASFEKDSPMSEAAIHKSDVINTTYDKDTDSTQPSKMRKSSIMNNTIDKSDVSSESKNSNKNLRKSIQKQSLELNSTFDKSQKLDSTYDKDTNLNTTFDKDNKLNTTFDKVNKVNTTFDKDNKLNTTFDKVNKVNTTFDKDNKLNTTFDKVNKVNTTFDKDNKLNTTFDKNSKSSLISTDTSNITLDKSDVSRISITSDESKDNIMNTTPVLIESSMDESQINTSKTSKTDDPLKQSPLETNSKAGESLTVPVTPLKREGTFTKDGSDIIETETVTLKTPTRKMSLPSAGFTPFPNRSSCKDSMMNVTRSLEKSRRSSLAEHLPRATRVMFCSPVNNPTVAAQQRRKVIKSSLKGSNKSFVLEDAAPARAVPRKRSYTHNDVEETRAKRTRPADGAPPPRPPRARSSSVTAKLPEPGTPKKTTTPKKPEAKISRTKLPNFAALHQREFAKMESLDECQERKARRARLLLTPTGAVTVLERTSPKEPETNELDEGKKSPNPPKQDSNQPTTEKRAKDAKKPETPIKSLPTLKSLNPGYTRFGFKLNYDVNPFTITNKNDRNQTFSGAFSSKKNVKKDFTKPLKEIRGLKRQATLPSLTGATSAREVAKQTVMREKSFTDKRNKTRNENRTVIKGVRTNRRFELQMRMRNIE